VRRIAGIVQEALEVPGGWKKRKWVEAVAIKHDMAWQTIYKWIKKYKKKGLAGLKHSKKNAGKPRAWTPDAIDWWVGLCLKREHREIARDALYDILIIEAYKNNWKIGCYESAMWWLNKKIKSIGPKKG
jgi:transposase